MIVSSFLQHIYPFRHGRKKLLRYLQRKCAQKTLMRNVFGDYLLLDRRNYIDGRVLLHGGYEIGQVRNLMQQIEQIQARIFIDIGANMGVYTVPIRKLSCVDRIIAFEPDGLNFKQLNANIFLNDGDEKIEVRNEAVGDRSATVDFFVQRKEGEFSSGHSGLSASGEGFQRVSVAMVRLDDVLDCRDETICIKIDVEGHEETALKGMEHLLKNNRVLMQMEIFDEKFDAVDGLMREFGFASCEKIEGSKNDYIYKNV